MITITPNNNNIEFQLEVRNLNINKTTPRLVLEVAGKTLNIPLKIDNKGICSGVIPFSSAFSGKKGNLSIEVISENFYFKPYETQILFEGKR